MSTMLDTAITDQSVSALEQALAQQVATLERQLATSTAEREGLAQAVHTYLIEMGGRRELEPLNQMKLRAAEILGYDGMAEAARLELSGQQVLL